MFITDELKHMKELITEIMYNNNDVLKKHVIG